MSNYLKNNKTEYEKLIALKYQEILEYSKKSIPFLLKRELSFEEKKQLEKLQSKSQKLTQGYLYLCKVFKIQPDLYISLLANGDSRGDKDNKYIEFYVKKENPLALIQAAHFTKKVNKKEELYRRAYAAGSKEAAYFLAKFYKDYKEYSVWNPEEHKELLLDAEEGIQFLKEPLSSLLESNTLSLLLSKIMVFKDINFSKIHDLFKINYYPKNPSKDDDLDKNAINLKINYWINALSFANKDTSPGIIRELNKVNIDNTLLKNNYQAFWQYVLFCREVRLAPSESLFDFAEEALVLQDKTPITCKESIENDRRIKLDIPQFMEEMARNIEFSDGIEKSLEYWERIKKLKKNSFHPNFRLAEYYNEKRDFNKANMYLWEIDEFEETPNKYIERFLRLNLALLSEFFESSTSLLLEKEDISDINNLSHFEEALAVYLGLNTGDIITEEGRFQEFFEGQGRTLFRFFLNGFQFEDVLKTTNLFESCDKEGLFPREWRETLLGRLEDLALRDGDGPLLKNIAWYYKGTYHKPVKAEELFEKAKIAIDFVPKYKTYWERLLPVMANAFREYNRSDLTDFAILKTLFPNVKEEGQFPDLKTAKGKFLELAKNGRSYAKLFNPPVSYEEWWEFNFFPKMANSFRDYNGYNKEKTISDFAILKSLFANIKEGEIPSFSIVSEKFSTLVNRPYTKFFTYDPKAINKLYLQEEKK